MNLATGLVIPKHARYTVSVTGLVTAAPNGGNPCLQPGVSTQLYGPGALGDALGVYVSGLLSTPPSGSTWETPEYHSGDAELTFSVSREGLGAGIGCNAPNGDRIGGPTYTLSSAQSVNLNVLEVLPFTLVLNPSDTTVASGSLVQFGVRTPVPDRTFQVTSWDWAPLTGGATGAPPPSCTTGFGCRFVVPTSGTMTVHGTLGGFLDGHLEPYAASAKVTVIDAKLLLTCGAADPSGPVGATIRGALVLCRAQMSDSSVFTIDHRKATSNGTTIVDEGIAPSTGVSYDWAGTAAVTTVVSVSGTSNGQPVNATQSFAVLSRIGADAAWQNEDFANFPAVTPATTWASGAPLNGPYPGIQALPTGYSINEGDVGMTVVTYPNQPQGRRIPSGPNVGVRYTLVLGWGNRPEEQGVAPGVYVEQSLNSADAFYQRQVGPPPQCTQGNMATLSGVIVTHEGLHWTRARAAAQPLHIVRAFEGIVELPGAGASATWNTQAVTTLRSYGQAVSTANDGVETEYNVQSNSPACIMRP